MLSTKNQSQTHIYVEYETLLFVSFDLRFYFFF